MNPTEDCYLEHEHEAECYERTAQNQDKANNLRALAEAEALKRVNRMEIVDGKEAVGFRNGFIAGRTSVTRESIAEIIYANTEEVDYCGYGLMVVDDPLELADAILALFGEVAGDE